jgi:4-amino-4-deoxy-L-arabinose transferase-like glycosyltransferase
MKGATAHLLRPRAQILLLALITLTAAAFRFWQLDAIPPGFHYDEAYEALEAWRVVTQDGYRPIFFPGNFGVEPAFIYLLSLAFRVAEPSPAVARSVAALAGTLTVPALYLLVREMRRSEPVIPPATPLLAAASLAIMRWHILFSRVAIEPVLVPLALVLMLWLLWRSYRTNQVWSWALLGAVAGLGLYTYPAGRLLPAVLGAALLALWLADRSSFRGRWPGVVLAGATGVAVIAPLALNWLQHPDQLLLRSSQIAGSGQGGDQWTLWGNLVATLASINILGDPDPRNNLPGAPALDPFLSLPFAVGLFFSVWRWRRPAFSVTIIAVLAMLTPTILSEYAPHFRRAIGASPMIALLAALGLALMLGPRSQPGLRGELAGATRADHASSGRRWLGAIRLVLVIVILLGSAGLSVRQYFRDWGGDHSLFYAYDEGLWEIGQLVKALPAEERVLLSPRPPGDMTLSFAWREGPAVTHFDGRHAFVAPKSGPAHYVIIQHEDFRGGLLLADLYPQAELTKTILDRDGLVYAQAYRVSEAGSLGRSPKHGVYASWEDLALIGYDLDREAHAPGEIAYVQLWWQAVREPRTEWTVFAHLLGPPREDGSIVWAGQDARPGQGSAPTSSWRAGDRVLDEYQLTIPADAPPGDYAIEVGIYDPAADGRRGLTIVPAGQDHVIIGKVVIE